MRNISLSSFFGVICLIGAFSLQSCLKDKATKTYTILRPVIEDRATVLANIKPSAPESLSRPGKIFLYGSYLFINEVDKGVHVIDNSRPENPRNISFIKIPGNVDIAVKGNRLFADMYADLVSIDISDPLSAKLVSVTEGIFPERNFGAGFNLSSNQLIVDWISKDTTIDQITQFECNQCYFSDALALSQTGGKASPVPGIAGSMARFAIVSDILYAVNSRSLKIIDISSPSEPEYIRTEIIGNDIETIYPFKNRLFIGSATGMFIFNIDNPLVPLRLSAFSHARACDPVVADDSHAFVTLRTGNTCAGNANQLDVLDISNLQSPRLLKTYRLENPHGLSIDGSLLFICDGSAGLKIYDASKVDDLKMIKHVPGLNAYDVIAWNKNLILVAAEGIFQFSYHNSSDIRLLSTLPINRS